MDEAAALGIERDERAGAGAVLGAADEGRAQPAFALQADPGVGQVAVGGPGFIGQGLPQWTEVVAAVGDPGLQRGIQAHGLGPRRIERAVGHAVHAGRERLPGLGVVAQELAAVAVGQQQVERREAGGAGAERIGKIGGRRGVTQVVGDQRAAGRTGLPGQRIAHVGDHRHPPPGAHPGPGAARAQVAPGEDAAVRGRPRRQRGGGTGVELIAVAGHDQLPAGVGFPGEGEQAHGRHCAGFAQARANGDGPWHEYAPMFHALYTGLNFAPISKIETKQQLVDKP
ncbi:hypothetical protein D3C71_1129010 [compost metagenome]